MHKFGRDSSPRIRKLPLSRFQCFKISSITWCWNDLWCARSPWILIMKQRYLFCSRLCIFMSYLLSFLHSRFTHFLLLFFPPLLLHLPVPIFTKIKQPNYSHLVVFELITFLAQQKTNKKLFLLLSLCACVCIIRSRASKCVNRLQSLFSNTKTF